MLANSWSQFVLDRIGRCLKLFVTTESISCHEFSSQFGLAIFVMQKTPKTIANTESPARMFILMKQLQAIVRRPATTYMSGDNGDYSGVRLSQNGKMKQVKTATTRDYTFTARKMWFRNYYVAYASGAICMKHQ